MLVSKNTPMKAVLELGKIDCKGCSHCCRYGSGFLAENDAEKIAEFLRITKEELAGKFLEEGEKFNTRTLKPRLVKKGNMPFGKCVFLDESRGCKIHEVKPLQCKIGNCGHHSADLQKWFDLKFFVNPRDPESVRQYALWLEFNEPLPGGNLHEIVPEMKRLREILSYGVIR